ncbi:hypothetical protein RhiirB3_428558 [Rhizophagus irregularis]|nr:hypothetical protein RhiirB3_428558 [Rhizophagus irregularis]
MNIQINFKFSLTISVDEVIGLICLNLIFNELRTNLKSIYSCLFVNKAWCHLIVPILWERYTYFINDEKSKKIIFNIILSCLPTSSKQLLFDNDITLFKTTLSKSPTFNYISLFNFPKVEIINGIINMVFGKKNLGNYLSKRNLLEREICKSFISECKSIEELDWRINQPLTSFLGAQTRFSQLCRFTFFLILRKKYMRGLSKALAKKDTINSLILRGSVGVISHSFLTSLNNLKYLTIHYECENCEAIKELQKWLGNSKFPDLQSLDIGNDLLCFKELAMLIEKTKGNIFDITAYTSNKSAENTGKNLVCLFLHSLDKNDDIGDELLNILTKFSPESLTEIKVSGY